MLVAIVVVGGYVAAQALTTATTFFYNADEAVANHEKLGTSRFRLQGTVEPGTIKTTETGVAFIVTFNGAEVAVVHQGDPPELFRDAMPVVLEGHWDDTGQHFDSDRMLVKHDATYTAKNGDRLKEADEGGTGPHGGARRRAPLLDGAVNLALGTAGVVLGLVASIGAVVTLAVGLVRHRPDLLRLGRVYTWLVLAARRGRGARHGAGAHHPGLHRPLRGQERQHPHPGAVQRGHHVGRARGLDPAVGAVPGRATRRWWARKFRDRLTDPLVGWALLTMFVVCIFFFGLLLGPANPFKSFPPPVGYDGPGPEPAAAEQPPHGLPPADALPRLRRASRCRSPSPSPPSSRAGWARAGWSRPGAGRCSPGAS